MLFVNRTEELERLARLVRRKGGGFAVVHGRRRIGKTRLLVEWCARHGGLYTVADASAADVQRRYFAREVAREFPGFADVEYPEWRALFERLAREARIRGWRGPLVLDELPYAVASSPELPSVLQQWIDHDAAAAGLVVATAGSSQRMMQGIVLSSSAPLFGRAHEILEVGPLPVQHLRDVFAPSSDRETIEIYSAWGGVPRYWELAAELDGGVRTRIERLVLDPGGPLHREPDLLLLEETPPALEVRPLLDALGAGANRLFEIAGRTGRPATSLSRPISRLVELGLARREVPFGESERSSKRSVYRIADPFFRLWFRVVAPYRSRLASGTRADRQRLLSKLWPGLVAATFEDLCRTAVPAISPDSRVGRRGPWGPASRWWRGNMAEWDVVSESLCSDRLLLGEVKWRSRPASRTALEHELSRLAAKPPPELPDRYASHEAVRALFLPEVESHPATPPNLEVVTAADLLV